jgi:uncharacterized membrane protein
MTHVLVLLLAVGIGFIAGLRAFTAPAAVAWGAFLGWIDLGGTWASWMGHGVTVGVLTALAAVEFVTDQLPKTPSRKTPPQFLARVITGGFSGLALGAAWGYNVGSFGAGVIGAVLGTLAGYEGRRRLVAANGGRDLPIALAEDLLAVGGGLAILYLGSLL